MEGGDECRICRCPGRSEEPLLVGICGCRGSFGGVHGACLERWLRMRQEQGHQQRPRHRGPETRAQTQEPEAGSEPGREDGLYSENDGNWGLGRGVVCEVCGEPYRVRVGVRVGCFGLDPATGGVVEHAWLGCHAGGELIGVFLGFASLVLLGLFMEQTEEGSLSSDRLTRTLASFAVFSLYIFFPFVLRTILLRMLPSCVCCVRFALRPLSSDSASLPAPSAHPVSRAPVLRTAKAALAAATLALQLVLTQWPPPLFALLPLSALLGSLFGLLAASVFRNHSCVPPHRDIHSYAHVP